MIVHLKTVITSEYQGLYRWQPRQFLVEYRREDLTVFRGVIGYRYWPWGRWGP